MAPLNLSAAEFVSRYRLTRVKTEAATGYFDCIPEPAPDFRDALELARQRPNDEFLRRHLLRSIAGWEVNDLHRQLEQTPASDLFARALYFEACLLFPRFSPLKRRVAQKTRKALASATPWIYIRASLLPDRRLHNQWIDRFRRNIHHHEPLPDRDAGDLTQPVADPDVRRAMAVTEPLEKRHLYFGCNQSPPVSDADLEALANDALGRLENAGVAVGQEMRHESSLSPVALLRHWQVDVSVHCDRHRYRMTGEQISYGRGLDIPPARAACVMEIVERVSAYAGMADHAVVGTVQPYPLIRARASELKAQGRACLDPNRLPLEAPYRDAPLYWIEGQERTLQGTAPVLVPAQCIWLFCNLDEPKLFSALGSTGLGAGTCLAQAKCKALLETIERDSAATIPFYPAVCFDLETRHAGLQALLHAYAERQIHIGYVDITGPLGVPCCKCYVVHEDGTIAAGTGAHLNARQALISALTETPYPFPHGLPSKPIPPARVRVPFEDLPDYDLGDPERNLKLLESLLLVNGYEPIYVDLTREDIGLPVVRAIVPGMEVLGDFDAFSRVHPRLFGQYLKAVQ